MQIGLESTLYYYCRVEIALFLCYQLACLASESKISAIIQQQKKTAKQYWWAKSYPSLGPVSQKISLVIQKRNLEGIWK